MKKEGFLIREEHFAIGTPEPTFQLIRHRQHTDQISVLVTIPAGDSRQVSEAPLFGISARWILDHCDIQPIPEKSGETYEAISITVKTPVTTPGKEQTT